MTLDNCDNFQFSPEGVANVKKHGTRCDATQCPRRRRSLGAHVGLNKIQKPMTIAGGPFLESFSKFADPPAEADTSATSMPICLAPYVI